MPTVESFADYSAAALYLLAGLAIGAAIVGALQPRRQVKRIEERLTFQEAMVTEALYALDEATRAEPLAPPEAYEPGTFTPEERSEEYRGGPIYMDSPGSWVDTKDPSRPYIRLKWHEPDEPIGRL